MAKVKIAVIDTGVDVYDENIKDFLKFDRSIQIDEFENEYKSIDDVNGHGTLCAKTILAICKYVEIYPVKVFDDYGKTSSWKVIEVLKKILHSDIKIINISASTLNCPCIDEMSDICKELHKKGKIILCSHHNNKNAKSSIPTKFKEVIGVKGIDEIYNDMDYIYNFNNEIQMYANRKDCFIKFKNDITHFGRNSRAAAVASGIVANIIKNDINMDFRELEKVLIKESVKDKRNLKSGKIEKDYYSIEETKIAKKLVKIINRDFADGQIDLDFLKKYTIFNNLTDIGKHNAYDFLVKLNEEFSIDIDYREIFFYELDYLDNIIDIINEKFTKK